MRLYGLIAALLSSVLLLMGAEIALALVRHWPALHRLPLLQSISRNIYMQDRGIVQLLPEAARYDGELGYTLRPGRFRFSNTEFDVEFQVNRLGLRDDEESLRAPEIVVIGDSMAMGWGVEQEEAFPQVLERLSGRSVLNAAISSYGTARQVTLLSRLALGSTRYLLLQYCENDDEENRQFLEDGNRHEAMSAETYFDALRQHESSTRYRPGAYLWRALVVPTHVRLSAAFPWLSDARSTSPRPGSPEYQEREVQLFLNALTHAPVDLSRLEIVVFELNSRNEDSGWFVPRLEQATRAGPPGGLQIVPLPLARELDAGDFYVLDDHLTPAAHRKIAERMLEVLRAREAARE